MTTLQSTTARGLRRTSWMLAIAVLANHVDAVASLRPVDGADLPEVAQEVIAVAAARLTLGDVFEDEAHLGFEGAAVAEGSLLELFDGLWVHVADKNLTHVVMIAV